MQQTQQTKFRVLIGNTSARSRMVLSGLIEAEPQLEVVDTAQSREELLYKAMSSKPDLIVTQYGLTLSGNLPTFRSVYGEKSSLVLMVAQNKATDSFFSSATFGLKGQRPLPGRFTENTLKEETKSGLLSKLREVVVHYSSENPSTRISINRGAGKEVFYKKPALVKNPESAAPLSVVVIGGSTGGSAALEYLVRDLPVLQPTVVLVAVHMPEKFTKRLAKRLQKFTPWRVEEGYQNMVLTPGTIIIAPGGQDMRVKRKSLRPHDLTVELEPSYAMDSPSVDALMDSAAKCFHGQVLGIILTGMGQDGTSGAHEIRKRGGVVIAQDEETSTIFGMAKAAIESGAVNGVFALGQINSIINRFVSDRHMGSMLKEKLVG
ncbi:chemotaxis protein CheB [Rufibacter tibetensis]|uniref:chemotaxis protein CheB n=1 Tax=Rufibacter tibetensis TaxID=512763 RepID=UPI000784BF80|nr:chemotaxis protein CheB [Rufibacter tibetensis]